MYGLYNQEYNNESLQQAIQTVDDNPQKALELLQGIPDPELLNHDSYMRYVVTQTQALYMDYQDITGDSSILKAQRYFAETQDVEMTTRSSFYAAIFCHEKQQEDKALEYFLLANYYAQLADNQLFRAKSAQWIGNFYYNQDELDSARDYYQQALELYTSEANAELQQLGLIYMLGRTYRELKEFDQALSYFNEGLKMAQKLNNQLYKARFLNDLGIVFTGKKEYQQAENYLDQALTEEQDFEDVSRVYLNYARLYKATDQPDSTIYYLDLVKNRVSEITYPYTREAIYQELALYYKKEGNTYEMDRYSKLEKKEEQLIQKMKDKANMQAANERFEAYKQHSEQKYNRSLITSSAIILVLLVLLTVAIIYGLGKYKLREQNKQLCAQQVIQKKGVLHFLLCGFWRTFECAAFFDSSSKTEEHEFAGKEFRKFGERFIGQVAGSVKALFEMSPEGVNALTEFTDEELCLTYLYWLEYPDNEIEWMIGHSDIKQRTDALRNKLNKFGLKEQDLKAMFA